MTLQAEMALVARVIAMQRAGGITEPIYANGGRYYIGGRHYTLAALARIERGEPAYAARSRRQEATDAELRARWKLAWDKRASESRVRRGNPFLNVIERVREAGSP